MDDKLMYFAVSNSTNDLEFDFPYKGGSTLSIIVRNMNKENDVMLQISKGQFGSSYSQKVKIKFDDGKIESYSFSDAADGSSNYIFLENSKSLIAKLKAAKHLKIEAPFFQAGRQVAEFDVSGFEWPH
ncbi:MAG: hypothetical protein JSR97_12415 [Verrucomicrobia bacterium]|nr:hypothetical protein [Verrucomicrobiota bacterium]